MNDNILTQKIKELEKEIIVLKANRGFKGFLKKCFAKSNVIIGIAITIVTISGLLYAAQVMFYDGDIISADQVNSNFTELYDNVSDLQTGVDSIIGYGKSYNNPCLNCDDLLTKVPTTTSGVYWMKPIETEDAFRAYCDMESEGGGWTLVWSNLRGGRGKPVTEMQWQVAINTLPKIHGELSKNLESFEVYTGLKFWESIGTNGQIRYDWSDNYGNAIAQRFVSDFSLDEASNYTISMSNYTQSIGAVQAGLYSYHNNIAFSTYDADNDYTGTNCSDSYSDTPWWYNACYSGSINGGGEFSDSGYYNGAYWQGASPSWGATNGTGAGNGWIYVK